MRVRAPRRPSPTKCPRYCGETRRICKVIIGAAMSEFRQAVLDASLRSDVRDAVAQVYRELQQQIDRRQPLCVMSGRCCRFEEFGHRLFVTTMEVATFVHDLRDRDAA